MFAGQVQGVGFRDSTRRLAGPCDVTGFVRNLSDGRVGLVAEGERKQLDALLADINSELGHFIRTQQVDRRPATGRYSTFEIRDSC